MFFICLSGQLFDKKKPTKFFFGGTNSLTFYYCIKNLVAPIKSPNKTLDLINCPTKYMLSFIL